MSFLYSYTLVLVLAQTLGLGTHRLNLLGWPMKSRNLAVCLLGTDIKKHIPPPSAFYIGSGAGTQVLVFSRIDLSSLSEACIFSFQQTMLEQLDRHMQQNEVEPTPSHTPAFLKVDHRHKSQNPKLLKDSIAVSLHHTRLQG